MAKGSVVGSALSDHLVSLEMASAEKGSGVLSYIEPISFEESEVLAE